MPLPVALLFRGYDLLIGGNAGTLAPENPFFGYLIAVSLPVVSVWIIWRLFAYTTPQLVRTVGRVTGVTVTAGAVVGATAVVGPWAGATAARWGPKAAAGQAAAQRLGRESAQDDSTTDAAPVVRSTETGAPSYRRTENEPRP
jgi:type IV secretion system protein TrbL